jgi:hypothetical protein
MQGLVQAKVYGGFFVVDAKLGFRLAAAALLLSAVSFFVYLRAAGHPLWERSLRAKLAVAALFAGLTVVYFVLGALLVHLVTGQTVFALRSLFEVH